MTAAVDLFGRPDHDRLSLRQLPLPLGWRADNVEHRLLVNDPIRTLLDQLLDWQSWSVPLAVLTGPARSGKSLLAAHVAKHGAMIGLVEATEAEETDLFHACTAALAEQTPLIVVADQDWRPQLPDLATRIAAAQDFNMPDPDRELLAALLPLRLADHRVLLPEGCSVYIANRMERSFAAVDAIVGALVRVALREGRALSLPHIRAALNEADLLPAVDHTAAA